MLAKDVARAETWRSAELGPGRTGHARGWAAGAAGDGRSVTRVRTRRPRGEDDIAAAKNRRGWGQTSEICAGSSGGRSASNRETRARGRTGSFTCALVVIPRWYHRCGGRKPQGHLKGHDSRRPALVSEAREQKARRHRSERAEGSRIGTERESAPTPATPRHATRRRERVAGRPAAGRRPRRQPCGGRAQRSRSIVAYGRLARRAGRLGVTRRTQPLLRRAAAGRAGWRPGCVRRRVARPVAAASPGTPRVRARRR